LGKAAALALVPHNPAQLWIAARNPTTGAAAISEIRAIAPTSVSVKLLELDLTSFASIKKATRHFTAVANRLDILMCNAGIMGGEPGVTNEGYEKQFGTNHVGHALLVKLLAPLLQTAASEPIGTEPRVVFVSSSGHKYTKPPGNIDFATLHTAQTQYSGIQKYNQSKLANALYPRALAKYYPQITSVSIHPGTVETGLFNTGSNGGGWVVRFLKWIVVPLTAVSVVEGAKSQLWASTAQRIENGKYYEPVGVSGKEADIAKNEDLVAKLWEWTEKELEGHVL